MAWEQRHFPIQLAARAKTEEQESEERKGKSIPAARR